MLGRPALRILASLLAAALPPLFAYALLNSLHPSWLDRMGVAASLALFASLTLGWVVVVTIVAWRAITGEASSMVKLAEHGVSADRTMGAATPDDPMTGAQRRLASALEERNRQIADLAAHLRTVPIADDPAAAARAMVAATRSVTGDPTWMMAVLRAPSHVLAAGTYGPDSLSEVREIDDVHRWASTVEPAPGGDGGARLLVGPWGAFVTADVAAGDDLRAILMAPWEGRAAPTPAEIALFSLLGQHAATAIEHALLYRRLRAQTDELNRMAAVQTDFLRGITHDLQTPLTSIRALASELQQSEGIDTAGQIDLETIARQADRLRRMVGQLLVVSRLEVGALTPRQEVFRVEPLVRRTWDALRADRNFRLEAVGPPHLVVADPDRLEQVLWALLDNAVKYSSPGTTVGVRISAAPAPTEHGLLAEIAITDEGIGMSDETRGRAAEQFFRADEARKLVPDGSGVGLYAARGLIEAMGGTLRIDSQPGAGTSVTITLLAEAADEASSAPATTSDG